MRNLNLVLKLSALVALAAAMGCSPTSSQACRPCNRLQDCFSGEVCDSNVCIAHGELASHCPAWTNPDANPDVIGGGSGSGTSSTTGASGSTSAGTHGSINTSAAASTSSSATSTTSTGTTTAGASSGTTGVVYSTSGGSSVAGCVDADGAANTGSVQVTTLAGNHSVGFIDGSGNCGGQAEFDGPDGIAVDPEGNLYVADGYPGNNAIRKIDVHGNVTTLAGNGTASLVDGAGGRGGPASFNVPVGVAIDSSGKLFIGDYYNSAVREIDTAGNVTTLASGFGFVDSSGVGGGKNPTAKFAAPTGVAIDSAGNLYLADHGNDAIRKLTPNGDVTTLAGTGTPGYVDGTGGRTGTATFNTPQGVAVDASGNIYVADANNNAIRKIDPSGNVTTLAGNKSPGFVDGPGGATGPARLSAPNGLAVDALGNVYVADTENHAIRKIDPSGNVTTIAGTGLVGSVDGAGGRLGAAMFSSPKAVAIDAAGRIFVADSGNNAVRMILQH